MINLKKDYTGILLLVIVLAAFGLRVYGINWDDGHMFHPDERYILMVTQKLALPNPLTISAIADPKSPLNPQSFAYGSFSFYLLAIMTQVLVKLNPLLQGLVGHPIQANLDDMRLIGRTISATFDTGTVLLTYLLGKKLYSQRVALLGASFVAFAVIDIQLSHFYASDTLLTFFIMLSTLAAFQLTKRAGVRESVLVGLAIGLALATKVSAAPIWAIVIAAHGLRLFTRSTEEQDAKGLVQRRPKPREYYKTILSLVISLGAAAVVFVAIQPYFIFDFNTFMRNVLEQNDMVRGIADLPYTRQYINTPPYLYPLQNLVLWGLGIPLGIVAVGGFVYVIGRTLLRPRRGELFLLSWVLVYFLITGSFHTKFMRYLLPMVPFICIFGATMLASLWQRFRQSSTVLNLIISNQQTENPAAAPRLSRDATLTDGGESSRRLYRGGPTYVRQLRSMRSYTITVSQLGTPTITAVAAIAVALTLFYALAFVNVYSAPHTAVDGSKWIYSNIPKGSAIAIEHWEEGMPVPIVDGNTVLSADSQHYRTNVLELYNPDGPMKQNQIVDRLVNSDYIIFFSNRLYATIPRLPERYPLTTRYYQLLFGEQLGFKLEAAFTSYPNFLGVTLVDDTFTVPKLPTPALLRNFTPSPLVLNLGKADESFTVYDHPKVLIFHKIERLPAQELRNLLGYDSPPAQKTGLLMGSDRFSQMISSGTFAQLFNRTDIENQIPIVVWIALVELLGLAAAPLAFKALGNLPDKGYGVAKAMGILLLGWLTWIVASVGLLPNTRMSIVLMLLCEILLSVGLFLWQRQSIRDFLRTRRTLIITTEMIFWGAFVFFLAIRMANPDLWHPYRGGEKPMDLAYLMAAIKSVQFPPYDPWFASGYMNYYYFGQVIVATLVKLSGIVPTSAYNLAVPLLFALTASGLFSVAYSIVGNAWEKKLNRGALFAGLCALAFGVLLGNLGGAIQIIDQITRIGASAGNQVALASSSSLLNGLWVMVTRAQGLEIPSDWYWASTRVIQGTINEFPFFTFLYADLHAHMIALPFTMLAMAFAVHFVKDSSRPPNVGDQDHGKRMKTRPREEVSLPSVWSLVPAALALGALYVTNSWDFPTYVITIGVAILIPWYHGNTNSVRALFRRALDAMIVVGLAILLYLPFYRSFQSFYFGVDPSPDKSDLRGYLVINGLFLFVLLSFLIANLMKSYSDSAFLRTARLAIKSRGRGERFVRLHRQIVKRTTWTWLNQVYEIIAGLALLALLWWLKLHVVALLVAALLIALAVLAKRGRRVEETFVLFLIVVGIILGIAVEFVAIKGDVGRMNTVFKFYLQVWMFWSVAGAFAAHWLLKRILKTRFFVGKYVWIGIFAMLVASAAVYPAAATKARVADRFDNNIAPTLDGTAYMNTAVYHDQPGNMTLANDLKAIRWIQDNIAGSPVILEGRTPLYRWGSRISIYTGLPTVLGWDWHQKQQRWGYQWMVDKRASDVAAMYSSPSPEQTMALLGEYRVSYIYVGELERLYYPPSGIQKFDAMVGKDLDIVYDDAGVRIYKVKG